MNIVAVIELLFKLKQKKLSLSDENTSRKDVFLMKIKLFQIFDEQNVVER